VVTEATYRRSNSTKDPASAAGTVSEIRLTSKVWESGPSRAYVDQRVSAIAAVMLVFVYLLCSYRHVIEVVGP
jgi:hypothetical protein